MWPYSPYPEFVYTMPSYTTGPPPPIVKPVLPGGTATPPTVKPVLPGASVAPSTPPSLGSVLAPTL